MQLLEDERAVEKISQSYKCESCGKNVPAVYQNNLCKGCLTEVFKRLVKVIDSVRK